MSLYDDYFKSLEKTNQVVVSRKEFLSKVAECHILEPIESAETILYKIMAEESMEDIKPVFTINFYKTFL